MQQLDTKATIAEVAAESNRKADENMRRHTENAQRVALEQMTARRSMQQQVMNDNYQLAQARKSQARLEKQREICEEIQSCDHFFRRFGSSVR